MYIIEVIPLTILPPQVPQLLSYFFNRSLPKGAVVEVLINNRKIPAAVIESTPLEEQKANLKKSGFQLKKISSVIDKNPRINEIQFKIALWLAKNYFAPLGLCLKTVLPPFFLKSEVRIKKQEARIFTQKKSNVIRDSKFMLRASVLLSRAKDIIKNIEPEIKKIINKKGQVSIIVPEISTAQYFYDYFARLAKAYGPASTRLGEAGGARAGYYETSLIHGKIGLKKYYKEWQKISSGESEIIIGTRQALFLPFVNLGLIILEDPANEAYKSDMSPKYGTDDLARKTAEIYSCPLIFVSQIPDIKNYYLIKTNSRDFFNRTATITKLPTKPIMQTMDMVQEIRNGNFGILSRNLADKIFDYAGAKKKILLFSSRKGYGGALVCENCSFIFKCSQCSVPMKIYKTPDLFLTCHRCSATQKIPQDCPNCRSYKLKITGFPGSQKLNEQVNRLLGNISGKTDIFTFDSSFVKTAKTEKEIIKKMEESESLVCIATQLIFSHRYNLKFDLIGIPSLDSLTVSPDFKSEEELFHQFEKILDFEPEELIIQSYNLNNQIIAWLKDGDYKNFYEKELQTRKTFWYPPFARLIKLSFRHSNFQKAGYEARIVAEKLKMAVLQRKLDQTIKLLGPSPAFVERERGLYVYNIILKILPEQKPEEILRFVPSNWNIDVDPRSIL